MHNAPQPPSTALAEALPQLPPPDAPDASDWRDAATDSALACTRGEHDGSSEPAAAETAVPGRASLASVVEARAADASNTICAVEGTPAVQHLLQLPAELGVPILAALPIPMLGRACAVCKLFMAWSSRAAASMSELHGASFVPVPLTGALAWLLAHGCQPVVGRFGREATDEAMRRLLKEAQSLQACMHACTHVTA